MKFVFSDASVFFGDPSLYIDGYIGGTASVAFENSSGDNGSAVFDISSVTDKKFIVFPGFTDVHVHFREPGFSYKETIATGSAAAAHGGYTAVCTMPNLSPVPDSAEHLYPQLELIRRDAKIRVLPFGSITEGQNGKRLSKMEELSSLVCGFSDDGRGVDDAGLMKEAMACAYALGLPIAAHCEDSSQIKDSPAAEWKQLERDITLAALTGVSYHVCHISTRESLELIRDAKRSGVDITCETAPHYLTLSEEHILNEGGFRMNPPLRSRRDRLSLLEGLADGTIDMIATDHAPHSAQEKSHGLASLNGIVGLETAFPVLYTSLVREGVISLERLITLMSTAPASRFGIPTNGFCLYELSDAYRIDPNSFASMGRSTPFARREVLGRCLATVYGGRAVYLSHELEAYRT